MLTLALVDAVLRTVWVQVLKVELRWGGNFLLWLLLGQFL